MTGTPKQEFLHQNQDRIIFHSLSGGVNSGEVNQDKKNLFTDFNEVGRLRKRRFEKVLIIKIQFDIKYKNAKTRTEQAFVFYVIFLIKN